MGNKKRNVKKFCFVYHTNTNISNRRKRQNESKFKPFQHKFRLQPSSSINSRQHQYIADLTSVSVRKQQCIASSTPVDSKQKQDRATQAQAQYLLTLNKKNVESTTHLNFEKQQDTTNLVHVDFGQQQEHVSSMFINTERSQNITNTTLVNFEQNDVENPTHSNFGKQQDIMNPVHVNSGQHQNKDSSTLINFEKQRSMTSVTFANCEVNLPLDIISPEFQFSNIESILSGPSEIQQLNANKSATTKSLNQEVEACYCDYRWVTPPHYGTLDWMNNSI
ncbi:13732_t:CDS:2, partial [Gigaspora margarita]